MDTEKYFSIAIMGSCMLLGTPLALLMTSSPLVGQLYGGPSTDGGPHTHHLSYVVFNITITSHFLGLELSTTDPRLDTTTRQLEVTGCFHYGH